MSGGQRGNWDLKGRDPAALVVGGNAYLAEATRDFGRQALCLVADATVEHLDLRITGDLVPLVWL